MSTETLTSDALQTREYFQNVINHAPIGIVTVSVEGILLQVNPAYCHITGYDVKELQGMNYRSLTFEEDLAVDAYKVQQLLKGEVASYQLEKRYVRKDGKVLWVKVTRSLFRDPITRNPLYFIAQVEDISANKEAELALRANEEYLNNIIENAPVGIVTVSLEGQILKVNPACCRMIGYDKSELEKMNYKALVYAEDLKIDAIKEQQLLDGKISSYRLERRYVTKYGKIIWVQVVRSIVQDPQTGTPLYFIAQVENVSERKQAEKTLQESEERFHSLVDNAPVGIAKIALDGHFIQVNPALCQITGYDEKALYQLTYQELTYREDLPANIVKVQELLDGKISSFKIEKRYIRKDGKIIWVQVTRSVVKDKATDVPLYFIAQVEDISDRKELDEKLKKSVQEVADLYENAPCGYHSLDVDGVFVRINATELQWLGYLREEVIGKMKFTDLLTPAGALVFEEHLKNFSQQGFLSDLEAEMRRKDGSTFTVLLSASGTVSNSHRYAMSRSTMFNITDRKRTEKALQDSEARFRNIMDNAPIGMATQSLEGQFLQVNRELCTITGYKKEELEKLNFKDITFSEDLQKDLGNMRQLFEGKIRFYQIEKRIVRKDGSISWVEITRSLLHDTLSGLPSYFIVQIQDINDRISTREKIQQLAYHDILTGLPNRQSLMETLAHTLDVSKRNERIFAVMVLDLDKFKQINDTLGHDVGDEVLKAVTEKLSKSLRKSDFIARTGGDEFVVILTEISSPEDAARIGEKILQKINQPITLRNQTLQVFASVGIVVYPRGGNTIAELLKNADKAMYKAKESGGNLFQF